ncbi:MAG: SRPBCC family protein [Syntrophales bacterium]|jgi:uncharacterized membrane protein|nr:SRPBCC family protein [Syntrophales bacterium]MDD5234317.1 SRPBCC family protein [Syntrophales bacterium]MDD5533177.1 SRPBCC family protein [Syntrophales bacterium]HPL63091.1 SRPBCC family protein [Syntrophales bacterium]
MAIEQGNVIRGVVKQLKNNPLPAIALAGLGIGMLVAKGSSRFRMRGVEMRPLLKLNSIKVERSVTIDRPAQELYSVWRNLESLPCFIDHLESVKVINPARSHWIAKGPAGMRLEWDAVITAEKEGEEIAWRSVEGSQVETEGSVLFRSAPGNRGTEINVSFEYRPPAGPVGAAFARLLGRSPSSAVLEGLRHFKQYMETGEIPTTEGQPKG